MRLQVGIFAAAFVVLGSCAEVGDRVVYGVDPAPSPSSMLAYADTKQFDDQLYVSLKNLQDVNVKFPAGIKVPDRLQVWASKLKMKGGTLKVCDSYNGAGSSPFGLPTFAPVVANEIYKIARANTLYNSTSGFNALAIYDSSSSQYSAIRFVRQNATMTAAEGQYDNCK